MQGHLINSGILRVVVQAPAMAFSQHILRNELVLLKSSSSLGNQSACMGITPKSATGKVIRNLSTTDLLKSAQDSSRDKTLQTAD